MLWTDCGLAVWLAGIKSSADVTTRMDAGFWLEQTLFQTLETWRALDPQQRKLHFWRDRAGHEVDFILEETGKLVALEIKAGSQVTTSDATGIRAFRDDLKRKASLVRGVVLHGPLNWSRAGEGLELFQDLRPAFRDGGDAAIIPPVPEKEIPPWLRSVWGSAEEELGRATAWIISGYSLPAYDAAIVDLLRRAAKAGNLRRILVLDPHAPETSCRYSAIVQNVQMVRLDGLPDGVKEMGLFL